MDEPTDQVMNHYAEVARKACREADRGVLTGVCASPAGDPCCGDPLSDGEALFLYAEETLAGLPAGALVASRGCGDPVACASLQPGERVLDLGSGGGIDAFIAARLVGPEGSVWGLDMTAEMVGLARRNASAAGVGNVTFLEGSIEHIPLPAGSVDVVISNCVINLCADKAAAFAEARRVLVPGGRLVVSDIVAFAPISAEVHDALSMLTGCRNGISEADSYARMVHACGFAHVSIEPKTMYTDEVLDEKARRKNLLPVLERTRDKNVDGLVGSAIVYGSVEEER